MRTLYRCYLVLLLLGGLVACQPVDNATPNFTELSALPATAPAPADNPSSPAKVNLGRVLFWDPILSGTRDVSCASCHHPANAYAENLDLGIGVNGQGLNLNRRFKLPNDIAFTPRNTPTVLNTAFNGIAADGTVVPEQAPMFWDSRVKSLETQSLAPISTLEEMRGHAYTKAAAPDSVVARLRAIPEYEQLFTAAFGEANTINATNLSRALACFERSLTATDAPFDRYLRGDKSALTAEQVRGMNAFVQSGCAKCHNGPMLSDYKTHIMGSPDNGKNASSDSGQNGTYAFRTPSLRQVAQTAPYMHAGKFPTLDAVLRFYDPGPGPRPPLNPNVAPGLRDPLFPGRVTDPQAIIAFLASLSASSYDQTVPQRVPSNLKVGGNIN